MWGTILFHLPALALVFHRPHVCLMQMAMPLWSLLVGSPHTPVPHSVGQPQVYWGVALTCGGGFRYNPEDGWTLLYRLSYLLGSRTLVGVGWGGTLQNPSRAVWHRVHTHPLVPRPLLQPRAGHFAVVTKGGRCDLWWSSPCAPTPSPSLGCMGGGGRICVAVGMKSRAESGGW